jgi:hypothetical protein
METLSGAGDGSPGSLVPEYVSALSTHRRLAELRSGPIPVVLDTSGIRTGLHVQIAHGKLPACLWFAAQGQMRLFMEKETFLETQALIPRFAGQLGVSETELRARFDNDWVPRMRLVSLPVTLRALDPRAGDVQARDATDYASAALAALLSPCVLLTRDKDFAALGIDDPRQGTKAIVAAIGVQVGEQRMSAMVTVPAMPVAAAGSGIKMAADRYGTPVVAVTLAALIIAGILLYRAQPPERKKRLREGVAAAGRFYLDAAGRAAEQLAAAEAVLYASAIPGPLDRTPTAAVLRRLATAPESMSAAQISESLDDEVRPSVPSLRAFLHANKVDLFAEVRYGGFLLGYRSR